jgi:glycosyltransferase involved in cell wall biosynthesis
VTENFPDISIIIPMKDEQQSLASLFSRLMPILENLGMTFEIVCVNDGSTDGTVPALMQLQRMHRQLVIVDLTRNFGKEAALTAGLFSSKGRAVIPLDADLQDPPELIPDMIAKWKDGAEVVLAVRRRRETDTYLKRLSANAFYVTINKLSDIDIPPHAGDFRLMDRIVVDALVHLPERTRFNKGLFAWLGFRTAILDYERPQRVVGETKWRFGKLWSFALDGITSFSSLPLRVWSYAGVLIALAALLYGLWIIVRVLVFDSVDVPGYASLMVAVLFSCGITLIGLGVIGEYLSRIFIEVKQRPLYVVRRIITAPEDADR